MPLLAQSNFCWMAKQQNLAVGEAPGSNRSRQVRVTSLAHGLRHYNPSLKASPNRQPCWALSHLVPAVSYGKKWHRKKWHLRRNKHTTHALAPSFLKCVSAIARSHGASVLTARARTFKLSGCSFKTNCKM